MVEQLKLHLHLHVLLLLFVFNHKCLCYIITTSASTRCPWYTCNSSDNFVIRYPFYEFIPTSSPSLNQSYCGYPQFYLTCSSTNNQTLFSLADKRYVVKDINYTDYTLSLVDADVLDDVLQPHSRVNCPRAKHNTTIYDSLPLTFSPYTLNLTFYFNCTLLDDDDDASTLSPISCLSSSANRSYVFLSGKESSDIFDDWWNKCQDRVDITVLEDQIKDNDLIGRFGAAMKQGFMLDWRPQKECRSCENNGGNCGYNSTSYEFICYCKNGGISSTHCKRAFNLETKLIIGFGAAGASITMMLILFFFMKSYRDRYLDEFMRKSYRDHDLDEFMRKSYRDRDLDEFMRNYGSLAPKQYNYSDVKRITNSFASKLGQGGYGSVYKGKLSDGRPVAVKILSESKGNGQDFFNEVASISRTSHVNVVSLLGFCCKGTKRALIYEFMSNFSLDKFLFNGRASSNTNIELDRASLLKIAIGIARGLEYLHSGCNTRILHLDIKPHNILLDQDWCPKISDFGLAKLCQRKESVISTMGARGTIGYIAPEVFNRGFGRVSYKSDVYSYGMMILEMAGVGKQAEPEVLTETSEMYFPDWIYKRLEAESESVPLGDNAVTSDAKDKEIERKMIVVGLWCIQTKPADRPSMTKVTEMLEGSSDLLQTPPKPFLFPPTTRSSAHYYSSSFSSTPQVIDHQS